MIGYNVMQLLHLVFYFTFCESTTLSQRTLGYKDMFTVFVTK